MNSVFAQYEELSSPQFAVINLSLRLRLITANFGLDNSSYRAQPHSIIVNYILDVIFIKFVNISSLSQPAIFFTTSDILIELFYNVNISARIHPPLKQITPLKS